MGIEVIFMYLTKKPTKTKKILILHNCHTEILKILKELTHDFGEKSEIFLFVFFVFNKKGLEIMAQDHLVRKQALDPWL